ncbi:MAG: peptidase, partial [Planctomycetota bacterium]
MAVGKVDPSADGGDPARRKRAPARSATPFRAPPPRGAKAARPTARPEAPRPKPAAGVRPE